MTSTLRVIWPDGRDARPPSTAQRVTLSQFYREWFLPRVRVPRGSAPDTLSADRTALRHWVRITGDPPLAAIDDELCAAFVSAMYDRVASPATVRKTCIHLQAILYRAGPRTPRYRTAAGLLEAVPYLERPAVTAGDPRPGYTPAELSQLLAATAGVKVTSSCPAADQPAWWRSLLRFVHHTGLRVGTVMRARWSWLDADGWLHVPPAGYKQHKAGRRFYLSEAALEAAEGARTGQERMFAWQHWEANRGWFYRVWRSISDAALPPARRAGFYGLRRATLSWLAARNPLVARLVAGHRKLDVLEDHYIDRRVVVELLEALPRPEYHPPGPRQLTLFPM